MFDINASVEPFEFVMNEPFKFIKSPLRKVQDLGEDQVLISPKYVGICGSDLYLIHMNLKNLRLGHEWVGEVTAIGSNVKNFKRGDLATGTGHFSCGACASCIEGSSNLCADMVHFSSNVIGAIRSEFAAPANQLIALNSPLAPSLALLEVFAVGEEAFKLLEKDFRKISSPRVLILGLGPIGLATSLVFNSYGANVTAIERSPSRVQRALGVGINALSTAEAMMTSHLKNGFDLIVDCTNDYSGSAQGGLCLINHFGKKSYCGLIVGKYVHAQLSLNSFNAKAAQLTWMRGVSLSTMAWTCEKWVNQVDKFEKAFISHIVPMEETNKAFELTKDKDTSFKVIISI